MKLHTTKWLGHNPSPSNWQVLIYGGTCPRTGEALRPEIYQFHRSYSLERVRAKASALAEWQKRTNFAIRDTAGTVVYDGPVRKLRYNMRGEVI